MKEIFLIKYLGKRISFWDGEQFGYMCDCKEFDTYEAAQKEMIDNRLQYCQIIKTYIDGK